MFNVSRSSSRHSLRIVSFALLLAQICCARTSISENSNANQNINVARNNTTAETAEQRPNGPSASPQVTSQSPSTPDELVREFYAWYLSELRDGKKPFSEEERMKQYVTDDLFGEIRKSVDDSRVDPVLSLPSPDSGWHNMKVEVAKPKTHKGKDYYDSYVEVKYKGFTDRGAAIRNGTRFTTIADEWTIGLQRTGAGWRIASIGIKD